VIRRRPLRRAAATAAVVGGASYAGHRMAANAEQRPAEAEEAQYYAGVEAGRPQAATPEIPAAHVPEEDPTIAQLQRYAELHKSGVLTDEEFATAKAKLLAGPEA
jgi:multidrug resistance efflux pump